MEVHSILIFFSASLGSHIENQLLMANHSKNFGQMSEAELNRILSLKQCYMGNDEHNIVKLKPWIEPIAMGSQYQLRPITLYALYKCMAENCIFSTNDDGKFLEHMEEHEKLVGVLISRATVDPESLSRRKKAGWLECAYCSHIAETSTFIVEHIKQEHACSPFQCSLCFYRTKEISNMQEHFVKYHSLDEDISILVCRSQQKATQIEIMEMMKHRKKYLPPLVCSQGNF